MNYKEGQRVKLRDDLVVGKVYGGWAFNPHGKAFIGKIVTLDKKTEKDLRNDILNEYFSIKEADTHRSLFITLDMIDHEGSKYILNTGDSLEEVFKKVTNNDNLSEEYLPKGHSLAETFSSVMNHEKNNSGNPTLERMEKLSNNNTENIRSSASDIMEQMDSEDNIKPSHYRRGSDDFDLFEAAYRTRPFNEFRAIMEFVAERYIRRFKGSPEKRIEDLGKAQYTLKRLKEKEVIELKKKRENDQKIKDWFAQRGLQLEPKKQEQDQDYGQLVQHSELSAKVTILNNDYFDIQNDQFRLSAFNYVFGQLAESYDAIQPKIYQDIARITYQTQNISC